MTAAARVTKLSFTIQDIPRHLQTHRILDLCDYLAVKVLDPMLARNEVKWDRQFQNFFQLDNTCDPLEPTGVARIEVPQILIGQIDQMVEAINDELRGLGIKTAPLVVEGLAAKNAHPVIVITILDNPTVYSEPPEVNMSYTRGRVVLRDLLGYKYANGHYEFTADDLLDRISHVTDEKIAACTASPVRDAKAPTGVRRMPSPVSMKAVRRCLDEIRCFAQWALNRNYHRLAAT